MRVCIYTAIYGGYDELKPAVAQSIQADFVCFTDRPPRRPAGPWRVLQDNRLPELHPRLRAKWFKTHPHLLFEGGRPAAGQFAPLDPRGWRRRYTHTIWLDASLQVTGRHLAYDLALSVEEQGLALIAHPDRDCIYDEAVESLRWQKYADLPVAPQVEHYRGEGFPAHQGLWAGGVIARRVGAPAMAALDEAWWQENLRWTYQDQLSLPVVLWRHGVRPAAIDGHLWNNPWFQWVGHQVSEAVVTPSVAPLVGERTQ